MSQAPQSENRLQLVALLPEAAPENYKFGNGAAAIAVEDKGVKVKVSLAGAMPKCQYDVYLAFDYGTSEAKYVKVGSFTTDDKGVAAFSQTHEVAPGSYIVGLLVNDATSFQDVAQGRATLASVPMCNQVTVKGEEKKG